MTEKFIKTIIIFLISLSSIYGCSDLKFGNAFLEKAPGVDITIDTIFSSKLYAERELVSAYATLRTCLTVHENNGKYEHQNAGNKIGWDNLDALTDINQSHCTWGGAYGTYYSGQYNSHIEQKGLGKYCFNSTDEASWKGIRRAYLFIENVDRVPDMTDQEKIIRKGEARMIIALHMHELLRHFGGVPILYESVSPDKEMSTDYSRRTVEECVDFIVGLCDQAAEELPWTVSDTDNGRMTKAGALALKARVLSFAASPLFNSNEPYMQINPPTAANQGKLMVDYKKTISYGNYSAERWQAVLKACEDFFEENEKNSNAYRLVDAVGTDTDAYRQAFASTYADRTSPEIIIHTGRAIPFFRDTYHRYYFGLTDDGAAGRGYGGGCITLNYVDMFTNADGTKSDYRTWLQNHPERTSILSDTPFMGKDPRLYETVLIVGDKYQSRVAQTWHDGLEHGSSSNPKAATGFIVRKFLWDFNESTFYSKATNSAYIRLAELYLVYAEALNETGNTTKAIEYLNKVRSRVGLPDMTNELLNHLQSGKTLPIYEDCSLVGNPMLREEILDERAREFCFEEVRWFDMIRWERDDIFQKELYGIDITIKSGSYEDGDLVLNYSEPKLDDIKREWARKWDRKWFLSAFPVDEVNKGYGLVQNPGW